MYLALMSLAVLALMMLPGKTFLLQIITGNLRTYRDTLAKLDLFMIKLDCSGMLQLILFPFWLVGLVCSNMALPSTSSWPANDISR